MYPIKTISDTCSKGYIIQEYVFFKWTNEIYVYFMLDIMRNLEPMDAIQNTILLK